MRRIGGNDASRPQWSRPAHPSVCAGCANGRCLRRRYDRPEQLDRFRCRPDSGKRADRDRCKLRHHGYSGDPCTYVIGNSPEDVRRAYFNALYHELENGGLEAMLYDLLNLEIGNWHPRQVYETEALREQKEQSLSLLEQWLEQVLQEGKLPKNISPVGTGKILP